MKYVFDINEQSIKGKETLEAIKNLGVNVEKLQSEKVASEKLGMPGYKVTQEQMRNWLNDAEQSGEIDFSSIEAL